MAFRPSKKKRHRRHGYPPTLMLTPLVDLLICLLLYLLQSYSVAHEVVTSDKNFELPMSTSQAAPHSAITIKVTRDALVVENEKVADIIDIVKGTDPLIQPLYQALMKKAEISKYIGTRNQSVKFRGEVVIQGDKNIPFILLKRIMYTCSRAEFGNIALAVLQK